MSNVSRSLIAAITLCALVTCTAIMAQETPRDPEAFHGSDLKPTLAELMTRFAEIESSYLPFHIEVIETKGLRRGASDSGSERQPLMDG